MKSPAAVVSSDDDYPIITVPPGAKLPLGTELYLCNDDDLLAARRWRLFMPLALSGALDLELSEQQKTLMAALEDAEPRTLADFERVIDQVLGE